MINDYTYVGPLLTLNVVQKQFVSSGFRCINDHDTYGNGKFCPDCGVELIKVERPETRFIHPGDVYDLIVGTGLSFVNISGQEGFDYPANKIAIGVRHSKPFGETCLWRYQDFDPLGTLDKFRTKFAKEIDVLREYVGGSQNIELDWVVYIGKGY